MRGAAARRVHQMTRFTTDPEMIYTPHGQQVQSKAGQASTGSQTAIQTSSNAIKPKHTSFDLVA